ncbi:helix-turn-helix domain-containing protein [Aurantivibrio infirmus]
MDLYSMSDKAIRKQMGERLKRQRLRQNITQQQLADATTLSLNTIKSLESGKGKLASLIAVLRELGQLEQLNHFIAEPEISPLQLAKQKGQMRERATGIRNKVNQSELTTGIAERSAPEGDKDAW